MKAKERKTAYYMRTSHYLQNMTTQVDLIEDSWKVYEDAGVSGRVVFSDRPAGKRLLEDIKKGKVEQVVVLRLDRLGRDTADILNTIKLIHQHKVSITSKNEGITTLVDGKESPMSNLLINILSSLAEWQYHQTREKTLAGIALAQAQNKYRGRKAGATESTEKFMQKDQTKKIIGLLKEGVGIRPICRYLDCSPNTVYKAKALLNAA